MSSTPGLNEYVITEISIPLISFIIGKKL
jgi:hypothetical protein